MSFPVIRLQPRPLICAELEHKVDSIEIEPTILTDHKALASELHLGCEITGGETKHCYKMKKVKRSLINGEYQSVNE